MMKHNGYILFREIQQEIKHYYETTGQPLGFREAVQRLSRQGRCHEGTPVNPDFSLWDTRRIFDLKLFTNEIPVFPSEVLSVVPKYSNGKKMKMLPVGKAVQISPESAYAPEVFTVLSDYVVILYVLSGSCTLHVKEEIHQLSAGELVVLAPGTPYYILLKPQELVINILSQTVYFQNYFFGIMEKDKLMYEFFQKALYHSQREYLIFLVPPVQKILTVIQNLFSEFLVKDAYSVDLFYHYLQIFYGEILRSPNLALHRFQSGRDLPSYALFPVLLHYIRLHYAEVTLASLAAKFHYHPAYLSRLIREQTGQTLMEILTELRMEEAKTLLAEGTLSVGEIGSRIGYHSGDYFSAAFRKHYGMAPSAYRKTCRRLDSVRQEKQ